MKKSAKNLLFSLSVLLVLLQLSGCDNPSAIDDRIESILEFPDQFDGLTHDIIFVSDSVITRIDRHTNEVYTYKSSTINDKPQSLRITSDGRYLYFIDRSRAVNSTGPLKRLDLQTGSFLSADRPIILNDFDFLNDSLIVSTLPDNHNCSPPITSYQVIKPLKRNFDLFVCDAIESAAVQYGIDPAGNASNVIYNDGQFFFYYRVFDNQEELPFTYYKFHLELTNNSITVTSYDSLLSSKHQLYFGKSGRYAHFRNNDGVQLKDLYDNSVHIVDPDVSSFPRINITHNDTYLVVKKRREYSREFSLHDGYHLYHIPTETYTHVFPESLGMDAFRISPDGSQFLFLASFDDNRNWHVTVTNSDGSGAAVLSDQSKRNVMPRFRRAD